MDKYMCRAKRIDNSEWVYGYYFERKDIMGNIIESVIIEDAYEQIHGGRRLLESMFNKECLGLILRRYVSVLAGTTVTKH